VVFPRLRRIDRTSTTCQWMIGARIPSPTFEVTGHFLFLSGERDGMWVPAFQDGEFSIAAKMTPLQDLNQSQSKWMGSRGVERGIRGVGWRCIPMWTNYLRFR
jgi:hypothetical protein